MSVSIVASLRLPPGRCMRHATTGMLSVRLQSRTASFQLQALVPLQPHQRRFQSQVSNSQGSGDGGTGKKPKRPKMPFRQFVGQAMVGSLRNLAYAFTPRAIRSAYRDYPYSTLASLALFSFVIVYGGYLVYTFIQTFYGKDLSAYPREVADYLRRALHATIVRPNPDLANRMYKKALDKAAELGMDPFSDEVLGIKIRVAAWLEHIDNHLQAVQTLEFVEADCRKWVDVMEYAVKEGVVDKDGNLTAKALEVVGGDEGKEGSIKADDDDLSKKLAVLVKWATPSETNTKPENLWHRRERLLAKAIYTSVKLGELYADEHILDGVKSQEHLSWAVEHALKEFHRRRVEGTKPTETTWLTPAELGGAIESLARDYERKSQHQYVIPLYFQALRLCDSPCHRVVIMNNISAAFAQRPAYATNEEMRGAAAEAGLIGELLRAEPLPVTREECLEAARNWARNAYDHAADVKGVDRTDECDQACAVALCNWGDVAAMQGKKKTARDKYNQCIEMSNKLGFTEGVTKAKEGLARLT